MDKLVTYQKKCMMCNNISSYIMRDARNENRCKVNIDISDSDVYQIISNNVKQPMKSDFCEECKQQTLQMIVGWKY